MFKKLLLPLFLFSMLSCPLLFGGTTGKIAGKVVDQNTGQGLPGVNIMVEGTTLGAATDFEGDYSILNIPPGEYTISARMIGYNIHRVEHVKVSIDLTSRINFNLTEKVLELGQTVTIVADKPLIQKDLTMTSASVSSETINMLPVEEFADLVNLQAGVVTDAAGGIHIRGGRSNEVMYMIDGIPVNDVFSGDFALQVENNAIQELEIISGTFNAEYGQVQSGLVNIVTKEGTADYKGRLSFYTGDYISTHENIFRNIDQVDPTDVYNIQGNFSGGIPGIRKYVTFFMSAKHYYNDGYIYGKRVVLPSVLSDSIIFGDNAFVSMNRSKRSTLQGKLTFKVNSANKINIDGLFQQRDFRDYSSDPRDLTSSHSFRYNPDGYYKNYQKSWSASLKWTSVLGKNTFVDFKGAMFSNRLKRYVFENPNDPRYSTDDRLRGVGNWSFYTGGTAMGHFYRETRTGIGKIELTSQMTKTHQIKAGIENKYHRLWLHEFELKKNAETDFQIVVPPINTPDHNRYVHHPLEFAAYVQDKMEFDYLIINAGVRFDYFQPDGQIPTALSRPRTSDRKNAAIKYQISPRFGLAFPITDKGVIHMSYGHFFQIPPFEFLYSNPSFTIDPERGRQSVFAKPFGNADLEAQKTVSYEIGLQQQLFESIALDITGYYKDIRNLLGTEINVISTGEEHSGSRYGRYINRDYGNVKGITIALEKRHSEGFGATIDYTLQVAKGNASDPRAVLIDNQADPPVQSEKQLVPLNWDRTHSLNMTLSLGDLKNYNISLIGKLGTGLPYSPELEDQRTGLENSAHKPLTMSFDLHTFKTLAVAGQDFSLFLKIYNLFDRKNELNVFSDTGRANYTIEAKRPGLVQGLNTKEEYFTHPEFYSAPRQVIVGCSMEF